MSASSHEAPIELGVERDLAQVIPTSAPNPSYSSPTSFEALTLLIPGTILGLLARLGIEHLGSYPNAAVFSLAWVQGLGCLAMGAALGQKVTLTKFYNPLYLAMTTGFCGSLTTFSSWQLDVFLAWAGAPVGRSQWHAFMDGCSRLIFTQAISMGFFAFGFSLTKTERPTFITSPGPAMRVPGLVISWMLFVLIYIAFGIVQPRQRVAILGPMAFSVFGTWTRHLLGVQLNHRFPHFPLGTFISNLLATAIIGGMYSLRCAYPGLDYTLMAVVQGIVDGLCGCLSTVSTYAAEVRAMKGWHVWVYVLASWMGAQALLVCTLGSVGWSGRTLPIQQCSA